MKCTRAITNVSSTSAFSLPRDKVGWIVMRLGMTHGLEFPVSNMFDFPMRIIPGERWEVGAGHDAKAVAFRLETKLFGKTRGDTLHALATGLCISILHRRKSEGRWEGERATKLSNLHAETWRKSHRSDAMLTMSSRGSSSDPASLQTPSTL